MFSLSLFHEDSMWFSKGKIDKLRFLFAFALTFYYFCIDTNRQRMGHNRTTAAEWRNESESRLILQGAELVMSNSFTDIEPLYTSVRGYAALYRAKRMGKWHVLKSLKAGYTDIPLYLGLLYKEFEIGYNLTHPNIAQTIGLERIDDLGPCIVMEYIDGRTLRSTLDGGRLTRDEARRAVLQICGALAYIHSRQIIHRDLKPENIMLTDNGGNVKLIDFGYSDADSYAVLKQPAGTRRYAAPEQKAGQDIDARVDIYALGIIMDEINNALPRKWPRLGRVAAQCTKAVSAQRYATASEIEAALTAMHTARKASIAAFTAAMAVTVAVFMQLGGNSSVPTQLSAHKASGTSATANSRQVDTVYVMQGTKPAKNIQISTDKAIENFKQDRRLDALYKFARSKTLAMLQADERILADTTVPLLKRLDLRADQFNKIEQAVKTEIANRIDPSSLEYPIYRNAVLDVMRNTYKDFQYKKRQEETENRL